MSDQLTLRDLDTRIQGLEIKIDKMSETFLTKGEFNTRADAFSTKHQLSSFKDDILKAIKDQADDYRMIFFQASEDMEVRIARNIGGLLEEQKDDTNRVAEGLTTSFEKIDRLRLENLEEHLKFDRRISRVESVTLIP